MNKKQMCSKRTMGFDKNILAHIIASNSQKDLPAWKRSPLRWAPIEKVSPNRDAVKLVAFSFKSKNSLQPGLDDSTLHIS